MTKEIVFEKVSKSFGPRSILKEVSFSVNKGEIVCLLGSSGCGKSTTLRILNMLEQKDLGTVEVEGRNIDEIQDINAYRSNTCMVFQQFNLFNNLNVLNNCTIALRKVKKMDRKEAEAVAYENLKKVGLSDYINANVNTLSGGQKQRVAIARALCLNPDILLFDEPTSALDPEMVNEVLNVIRSLKDGNRTMLIVTHEMNFAMGIADRILFMDEGRILEDTVPKQFFSNPKSERAKEFLANFTEV